MASITLFTNQFFAAPNVPLSGGKVWTYAAGTTTLKDTYTTSVGDVLNTNPIILNARGEADIWLSGNYKIKLTDASDVQIYVKDNISSAVDYSSLATPSGSSLVGFIQDGVGAVAGTIQTELRYFVRPEQFGAVGDGVTDDTAAFILAEAHCTLTLRTLYVPYGIYVISGDGLSVSCNVVFEQGAYLKPVGMNANAVVYDVIARTFHTSVRVVGSGATDPANGTIGIRVKGTGSAASRSQLNNCYSAYCKYGYVLASFSLGLTNCFSVGNTTNLSAYAPATNQEINDINIIGGNHSGPIGDYSIKIGDPDFVTTVPAGTQHGTRIKLDGFAMDGGTLKLDSASNVDVACYFEGPTNGKCIELGTSGQDGYVSLVTVANSHFRSANFAVYANAAVRNIDIRPCTYSAILYCALYISSDVYPYSYKTGYQAGSFALGKEVHLGQRSLSAPNFTTATIDYLGLISGVQITSADVGWSIPKGTVITGASRLIELASTLGPFYTSPALTIAGTLTGTAWTFTTATDASAFNGGDRLLFSLGGGGYIKSVDYIAGTAVVMGTSGTTNGAQTTSQVASVKVAELWANAAPTTGTYAVGSRTWRLTPTVGQPKSWACTVAGTPGTWVSEGNL